MLAADGLVMAIAHATAELVCACADQVIVCKGWSGEGSSLMSTREMHACVETTYPLLGLLPFAKRSKLL